MDEVGRGGVLVWRNVREKGGGDEGIDWRDKVVCGQSRDREVTICLAVFVYLSWAWGKKQAQNLRVDGSALTF